MPKLGTAAYFMMCVGAVVLYALHWTLALLAVGAIIYLTYTRNKQLAAAKDLVNRHIVEVKQWLVDTNGV